MAEESIAGGGLKQEMKRIKRKQRHLQSSQGLKKKIVEEILFSRVGYIGKDFKIQRKHDDWIEFKFN